MPRSRLFFFTLMIAGACAVTIPWIYNSSILLKPQQIREASEKWKQQGPASYKLEFLETSQQPDYRKDMVVHVVMGKVETVLENARFTEPNQSFTVDSILSRMQQMIEKETQQGGSFFATASFSGKDGHPTRFVLRRGRKRFELVIKLLPLGE
ncbi:MAG: hypothetical protein RL595_2351 [Planctomycetota bacterium]